MQTVTWDRRALPAQPSLTRFLESRAGRTVALKPVFFMPLSRVWKQTIYTGTSSNLILLVTSL